jgi:hypothetical protein
VRPVSEVESLYYGSEIMNALAHQQSIALGADQATLVEKATNAALASLAKIGTPEHLAASIAQKEIGRRVFDGLPDISSLINGLDPIEVSMPSPYPDLLRRINDLINNQDLDELVRLVPIRDTSMRDRVARALRFQSISDYQSAVRARLSADPPLAQKQKDEVGPLPTI